MEINLKKNADAFVISISGSLDIYTSLDFKNFLETNTQANLLATSTSSSI